MKIEDDAPVTPNHRVQHRYPEAIRFCALCGGEMQVRTVMPDRKRLKVCAACGYVDFQGPKLAAGCPIIDSGRVLLLRRGIVPQIGKWTFPGGYVDLGETPRLAALRETIEEVGKTVTPGPLLGLYSDPQAAVVAYVAVPGVEAPALSDEATAVRYFAPDEIPWDDLAFHTTREALAHWIASRLK